MHFVRRMVLCVSVVYLKGYFFAQLFLQMALSTFFIIVVGWYQPLESAKANGIALFSECVTLCILYIMMTFTDVNEPETRYEFGSVLIGLLFVYQGIRIAAMLHESCKTLQKKLKERIIKRLY